MPFTIRGRGETAALHFSDVMWFGVLPSLLMTAEHTRVKRRKLNIKTVNTAKENFWNGAPESHVKYLKKDYVLFLVLLNCTSL